MSKFNSFCVAKSLLPSTRIPLRSNVSINGLDTVTLCYLFKEPTSVLLNWNSIVVSKGTVCSFVKIFYHHAARWTFHETTGLFDKLTLDNRVVFTRAELVAMIHMKRFRRKRTLMYLHVLIPVSDLATLVWKYIHEG